VGNPSIEGNAWSTTGIVHVEVLNELVHASTVGDTIDVLVEVAAGPDYELAAPGALTMIPWRTGPAPGVITPENALRRLIRHAHAQAGQEEPGNIGETSGALNEDQLGSSGSKSSWMNEAACIGEKVMSIRQLIKRSHQILLNADSPSHSVIRVAPFRFMFGDVSPPNVASRAFMMGYLDFFAHIYAFYRGGVNIKFYTEQKSDAWRIYYRPSNNADRISQSSIVSFPPTSNLETLNTCPTVQIVPQNLEGAVDLHVPYYSAFHMCPVSDLSDSATNQNLGIFPNGIFEIQGVSTTSTSTRLYRSATDSFQFGYLLGPPFCKNPLVFT